MTRTTKHKNVAALEVTFWTFAPSRLRSAITPSGYRHTLAEETESLNLMLADVQKKLDAGTVAPEKLDPSLQNLMMLKKDGMIECSILLSASDAGIRYDYPDYRKEHRDLLADYLDRYVLAMTSTSNH